MQDPTLELALELISRPSVTPRDEGCQALIADQLTPFGFQPEFMRFGAVDNLWLRRGNEQPLFVFVGHTDVVPTGPIDKWLSDPFTPTIRDGYLYGRGAADMKTSIAAFVVAAKRFSNEHPSHSGSIALLLTSDEEGPARDGTVKVIEELQSRDEKIKFCLVGEPTSVNRLGDMIKVGRRGSLNGKLVIRGVQGHVAYPHLAKNPVHLAAPMLDELSNKVWDMGNDSFPATTFQISNISAGTGADNVIPGELNIRFNLRYSTESTADFLIEKIENVIASHASDFTIEWIRSGEPFLTQTGRLVDVVSTAIDDELGIITKPSTTGGTSDGRFVAPTGAEVVELGPVNDTIHKVNECVKIDSPSRLSSIYYRILTALLTDSSST